jgi:hypothetical protein
MKSFTVQLSTVFVGIFLVVSNAPAIEHYGGQGALPGQMPGITGAVTGAQAGVVHSAGNLIGLPVQDLQGQQIGFLRDVMIDLNQNLIGYAVVEVEGSPHLVPWAAFTSDHQGASLILNADRQTVVAAPVAPSPESIDESFGRQVHEHFGISPYWEEQEFTEPLEQQPLQTPGQERPLIPGQ